MTLLENVLRWSFKKRKNYRLFLLEILVLIVGESSASLQLKASKVPGKPIFSGKTAFVYSSISHKYPALNNMTNLVLQFKIPNYIVYDHYTSNGSRSPDDVTESQDDNFRLVALKFNELLTSENVSVQIAVHVHEDDGFADDSFHHAPCVVSLRHQIENPCGPGSLLGQTEVVTTQIPFYSPDCDSFGPLGLSSGGTKDSQITASSSQIRTFLPYSAKLEADLSGWIPLRGSGGELHDVHFIQVDLRDAIRTKFMFVVQGLSPKIPKDKIFLVISEDGLEWKEKKNGIDTAVDRSASRTVTVMKRLKFTATARFARVILPPFQKPGGEQPVYKVDLYGCLDDGKTKGKAKKVPVPVAVGMETGVIADNQLTSSSQQGPEYGAQYSRLNSRTGAGAWCAGSCDSSEYLQIDLGQVYLIFELEVQSKHDESENTNSVLSFYFEYSADGASWEYYTANGANKLFVGSPLRNLAVRHKLLFPVHAQFVRFRPQTDACTNMACMRVELFWYPDSDAQSPVIFGRSFLLKESTNTMFFCNTEVKKSESPCKGSTDGGETWNDLHQNVLNVLAFDPIDNVYYGISTNKKTFKRSKFSPFMTWNGINNRIWYEIKESPSLITATEVPFIPVLPGRLDEPFDALTVPSSSVSLKRRRRSVESVDMWGSSSKGLLFKPSGAIDWKMVYSWIDYPYDTKVDCLAIPCNNGTCAKTPDGGYKCNCFPGFRGSHCRQEIDECASNPCTSGAPCVDKVNGFTCICPIAFTGVQCDINIDDCAGSPCVNGDCVDGLNQYTCNCHPGNTGVHCEIDIDECTSSPCLNGGTCLNEANQFSCNCIPGFTGVQCETNIDECASNPCVNGDCVDGLNQYTCNCYPGNTGVNCEIDIDDCASNACVNGDCVDGVNQYTCNCHPGYTGVNCDTDIDECASNPCSNGGVCVNEANQFSCNCTPGFTGVQCETNIDDCASSPCINGDCVDGVNQYTCSCNPGNTGVHCETDIDECASSPCLNGGTCLNEANQFSCNCIPGFTGVQCETNIDECANNPCVNGDCVDGLNQYTCNCHPGNTGEDCEIDIDECASSPCVNGDCVDGVNQYTCNCHPGYTGVDCDTDIDECASNPCTNGGVCENEVNQFSCNCTPGFTGVQCETNIDDCASNPCVNGDCVDGVNQYTCNCYAGSTGEQCEFDFSCVASNPCMNGGTCVPSFGGGYTCDCTFFRSGPHCELGSFYCLRLPTYTFDPPHWPNSGKFDKIAFSLNADQKLLGISVGSTAQQGISVQLTIKVTDISGGLIASKTIQHTFGQGLPDHPVYFDQPILLTAGQQYIAASLVEEATSLPELIRSFDGTTIGPCQNPQLTVTFSDAPADELADSNGSTVQEGQIIFFYFKAP